MFTSAVQDGFSNADYTQQAIVAWLLSFLVLKCKQGRFSTI